MKLGKAMAAFAGMLAMTVCADPCWQGQKGSGYIDDEKMWSPVPAPVYSTQTASGGRNFAQIWTSSDWVSSIFLRDMAIFNGGFSVNLNAAYNNSLIFDGADVTLVHGDVPDGMGDRNGNDVFFCENGSGGDYRYFNCNVDSKRHAAYLWSNAWFRIDHLHQTPGSAERLDVVNAITFGRGYFLWGGTNLVDMAGTTTVNKGNSNGLRTEMVVTNSSVVFNKIDWWGTIGGSSLLVDGPDAVMEVLGIGYFGRNSSSTQPGTNVFTVSGGATMRVTTRSGAVDDTCIGPYSASPQSSRMVVTGEGSLFDYSLSGRGMRIYDGGSLLVTNGATARFGTSVTVMKVDGNPGGAIRVAGADSSLELGIPGAEGEAVLSVDGGEDSLLELDGGTVKANLATRRISVYLGQNDGRFGTLRLRGGTLDTGTNGLVRVGMLGSGFLDVSGGELTGCQYIEIAERTGATGPTTNHFRQTGGYVEAFNGVYCKQAADPQRHVFVELLGGVLCAHRMAGGGGVLTPEKDHSQFYANGGVLRSTDTGCYSESGPFIYGFNSIKLGPKGLTLDIRGRSNIRQRFTDAEGEEGRLFVTGPSTYATVWFEAPDGGDTAELVLCSLPTVAIGNTMTNWQTTVVVTNGAVLDVSCVDRLSLKGLSLGNAVSSGEVRLAATNRLSLSGIVPQRAVFRMVGAFEADTDYPLIKVKGRMGAEQTLSWKGSEVCGDVPSGCSPRLGSVYCADDDMTTLVFRFEQRREPAQSNVWTGASGAEGASWTNAACWSQGVPTAESIVEFASGGAEHSASLAIDGGAVSLGALAFSSVRDYVISGDGLLFFEDAGVDASITVAAGDHRIDVPVGAVEDISLRVAAGSSLTFGGRVVSSGGELLVNDGHETGRTVLEGVGSAFKNGITHRGGILEATSAEVFGDFFDERKFRFKGYSMLRVGGDPMQDPYRLPFGFEFHGGSSANTTWGSAVVIDTDRSLVVPPYVTSMTGGGSFVKFGRAPLVFETCGDTVMTLAIANGTAAWNNAQLPQNSVFTYDETTGKAVSDKKAYGGVNVYEGELVYRGADDVEPTASSQAIKNGFGTVVGFRTTNSVETVPGLVLDRVYADFGASKPHTSAQSELSYVSIAQDAHDLNGPYPRLATNAYLVVSNGSTLATGSLRVGATTFASEGFLHVLPRIVVDGSVVRVVTGLDFAAQEKVHAHWSIVNGGKLETGTNGVVWAGEAQVDMDGGSVLCGADAGATAIRLGAAARGTLSVAGGSLASIGEVTTADGAEVTFAFDGGALAGCADGGTIAFPEAVTLAAGAGGLHIDVPAGETWTLAQDVAGDGFVTLGGDGTLALSGTLTAGFAGKGTVSGGTVANCRIRADAESGIAPTFAGTAFTGRIAVDLGLDGEPLVKPYPSGVKVATFIGGAPSLSAFRRTGAGVDASGRRLYYDFSISDGTVTVDVVDRGMTLIVR